MSPQAIPSRCEDVYNRAGDLSVTRFAKEEQWNEYDVTFRLNIKKKVAASDV